MEDRIEDTNGSKLPDEGDVTRGQEDVIRKSAALMPWRELDRVSWTR